MYVMLKLPSAYGLNLVKTNIIVNTSVFVKF